MADFGLSVKFETDFPDSFGLMDTMQAKLRESMRNVLDLEAMLSFLREAHPERARRWREAADEHGKWLAALYPPHPTAVCETCGQALPDYPDDDDWDD